MADGPSAAAGHAGLGNSKSEEQGTLEKAEWDRILTHFLSSAARARPIIPSSLLALAISSPVPFSFLSFSIKAKV